MTGIHLLMLPVSLQNMAKGKNKVQDDRNKSLFKAVFFTLSLIR